MTMLSLSSTPTNSALFSVNVVDSLLNVLIVVMVPLSSPTLDPLLVNSRWKLNQDKSVSMSLYLFHFLCSDGQVTKVQPKVTFRSMGKVVWTFTPIRRQPQASGLQLMLLVIE